MKFISFYSALITLWVGASGQGIPYVPMTSAELGMAENCKNNLPPRDKFIGSLIRYKIENGTSVTIVETNAQNSDLFLEDCTSIGNFSDDNNTRKIVRLDFQKTCQDVLFLVDGKDPVVCGYKPIYAVGKSGYRPRTEEEREIETRCKEYLPRPHGTRATLEEYEADPDGKFPGYVILEANVLNDEGPYKEDCSSIISQGDRQTRSFIFILESSNCHNVLFFANGTNPVVCLYVTTYEEVHGRQGVVYQPTTSFEEELATECKKNLSPLERYNVTLVRYTLSERQRFSIHKTDTANLDPFVEDCLSVDISNFSVSNFRDILFLVNDSRVTCHDVLFLGNDADPVLCYYYPIIAEPIVEYMPQTSEEREIERECMENLPRPTDTLVSLVEYESHPEGAFPGYTQWDVTYPNSEGSFREDCTLLFNSLVNGQDTSVNETRPVILILEFLTCHDVLFFNNETNPVVCIYTIPPPVMWERSKTIRPYLHFTLLLVITSTTLLVL